jgi:hypothetical protein
MGKKKPHNFDGYGWGVLLNELHDQGRTAHLLRGDNSPACGVSYYTATQYDVGGMHRCMRCERIAKNLRADGAKV